MYYRLKAAYVLRGWNKTAWALVKRPENSVIPLDFETFQALLLCDGMTDTKAEYISDKMRQLLNKYVEKDMIEIFTNQQPLEEDQYYQYYDNRFVKSLFWSITGRCNYRCRHCYMDAPEGALGELSHEQAMDMIDQMAECGLLQVDITGGEPFLRKDFWLLIDRIQSYKMTIGQVYTNGWLLNDMILEEFAKRNLKPEIIVSFDGVGWHDWMRGVRGAEEAALRALKLCREKGFSVSVEMCVHRGNQDTLSQTVAILSEIGVSSLKASNVSNTVLWECNNEGNALNVRAYTEAMIRYIPMFYRAGMPMNITLGGIIQLRRGSTVFSVIAEKYDGTEACENCLLCGATRYTCYVTPEGRLLPCMPMTAFKEQERFPLVQDIGLKKGLSDSFYMNIVDSRVKDLLKANAKCAACDYKYRCGGGCRAIALEKDGNLMGCDISRCILWNEGYVERIRETAEAAIAKYCKT